MGFNAGMLLGTVVGTLAGSMIVYLLLTVGRTFKQS